jgi:hypothetical protein
MTCEHTLSHLIYLERRSKPALGRRLHDANLEALEAPCGRTNPLPTVRDARRTPHARLFQRKIPDLLAFFSSS